MNFKDQLKRAGYTLPEESLPPFGKPVTVVTPSFRTVGFLDGPEGWRHQSDQTLIDDVIAWGLLDHGKEFAA